MPADVKGKGGHGLVQLAAGNLRLRVAPDVGGCIAAFDYLLEEQQKIPILRGGDGLPEDVLDAGCFPLVPFSNRIRHGRFSFRGREVTLAPNMKGDPNPLHGQGWRSVWEVERADAREAELVFRHAPDEWPWAYEARQILTLHSDGLMLRLSCRNLAEEPMPCGLGFHPYFPCTTETRLDTRVESAWTIDNKVLPVEKVPATGRFDLRDRRVCGQDLDNGFGGWGGTARIHTPGQPFAIELSSAEAHFFQLYSPADGGLFVAEPVTHANAALNEPESWWPELGLRVLTPGAEMVLEARLSIRTGF